MSSVCLLEVSGRTYRTYESLLPDKVNDLNIQQIELPTNLIFIISGSRGEMLKRLEHDTNCRIQLKKHHGGVTIIGMIKMDSTKFA